MQLTKTIRLIFRFYKSFLLLSILVDGCCLYLFWQNGFGIFSSIFWFKIITLTLTFFFINSYKNKEYYYYQNLGISKKLLWISTLAFDFSLLIFLIIQLNKFR